MLINNLYSYSLCKFALNHCFHKLPSLYWSYIRKQSLSIGFSKLYFILSFDCDLYEDALHVLEVDSKLHDLGVAPVYAVPGEALLANESIYLELFTRGREFINHGYSLHTYFDKEKGRHASCFFYDQLHHSIVVEDVTKGHETLISVFGTKPQGFRTPHFGTFQSQENLELIYSTLNNLGCLFSTSTTPEKTIEFGPLYKQQGIIEIPVSGSFDRPLTIFDSWGYFVAPDRIYTEHEYLEQMTKTSEICHKKNVVGVLNYYADPSHIAHSEIFFKAVETLMKSAENITYSELLQQQNLSI